MTTSEPTTGEMIERLRIAIDQGTERVVIPSAGVKMIADRLESQEREIAELEEALKPLISYELENSEIKLKGESGAKKATVEDSAQIITQKLIESMKQVSKAMTVEDAQEFLDELTSKTGIKFNLIVPKKTNLEDLMELYASGNLQRIARARIKFNGDVIQGDFGVQDGFKVINGRVFEEVDQVEKAVEKEIKWLKEYKV